MAPLSVQKFLTLGGYWFHLLGYPSIRSLIGLILLGCSLWHLWTMAWLARCPHCTMADHLSHVVCKKLYSSTTVLCQHLWWPHSNCPMDQECNAVSIWQLPVTPKPLYNSILHL